MALSPTFANNDATTLASPVSIGATSLTLFSGGGAAFPNPIAGEVFALTLISATNPTTFEITWCTARSGDVCTITRAQEGTTALAWNAGDLAQNLLTAGMLKLMQQTTHGLQVFSASGSFTVPAGVYFIDVEMWGGGGGSGGANAACGSGGGAAGSYGRGVYTVTPAQVFAVTIGAGGTAGGNGGTGGTSTFGAILSVPGGNGSLGANVNVSAGGTSGGQGTGGQMNVGGSAGGSGGALIVSGGGGGTINLPGQGAGAALFGQGGYANTPAVYPAQGAGGVGSISGALPGTGGANGYCRVRW